LKTITYHKSLSGSTVFNHVIYNDEVSSKSLSALILLNDYLREIDEDYLNEINELQEYLNRRFLFLIRTKRKDGDLVCHYCGKNHLEIGYRHISLSKLNNNNPRLATIDHVIPVSSILKIDKLDEENWVVCCKKCNRRKGNMSYDEFKKNKKNV